MFRKGFVSILLVFLMGLTALAQESSSYLDVLTVRVRPEKRAEFDAVIKKMADANRANNGDVWLASETSYGEGNTVYFTTMRKSYGEIEQGMGLFMGALNKAYGQAEAQRLLQDFNSCILSERGEVRRRRPDLSPNFPSDRAAYNTLVGESRWTRTSIVRIRPGRAADYEAQIKIIKDTLEKADSKWVIGVSQSVAGQQGTVFYITTLKSSLGGFDSSPALRELLGEERYKKYQSTIAETVISSETIINRFLPQMSNAPEEIASVAPDFWKPAAPKPTTAP